MNKTTFSKDEFLAIVTNITELDSLSSEIVRTAKELHTIETTLNQDYIIVINQLTTSLTETQKQRNDQYKEMHDLAVLIADMTDDLHFSTAKMKDRSKLKKEIFKATAIRRGVKQSYESTTQTIERKKSILKELMDKRKELAGDLAVQKLPYYSLIESYNQKIASINELTNNHFNLSQLSCCILYTNLETISLKEFNLYLSELNKADALSIIDKKPQQKITPTLLVDDDDDYYM